MFIMLIELQVNFQLKMTLLPPKINFFFMKTIFVSSHKTIEENYTLFLQN